MHQARTRGDTQGPVVTPSSLRAAGWQPGPSGQAPIALLTTTPSNLGVN